MTAKLTSLATILLAIAAIILTIQEKKDGEFSPPPPKENQVSKLWTIERILDGDTLIIKQNTETRPIRLCGIDAPEKSQPQGTAAKEFIESAVKTYGNQVAVTFVTRDRYNRWIGEIFMNIGNEPEYFLNEALIINGYAWPYKQFWNNCPNKQAIAAAEELANQNGQGIWLNKDNIEPWKWRKINKSRHTKSLQD